MVPRPLGATGLRVSPIGLGTVKLGRNADVKYPAPFELPTPAQARALLEAALAMGVTLYDTAPAYGESEARLAPFVAAHRDEIVLCTKAGERWQPGASTYDFSAAAIVASAEVSLKRLGTDRLDLLLLHSDGRDAEILAATDALEGIARLKRSGKIRFAGLSAKTSEGIRAAIGCLDIVMAPFSSADPSHATALSAAHDAGLGILAIKGLSGGRAGASAAEAVRYVLRRAFVDTLVVGTLSPAHLEEAVRSAAPDHVPA